MCIIENDHFLQTIIAKLQTPDPFNDLFDTFQRFLSSACYKEFERFEKKGLLVNHGAFRYNNGGYEVTSGNNKRKNCRGDFSL